jgi:hypothetical protein
MDGLGSTCTNTQRWNVDFCIGMSEVAARHFKQNGGQRSLQLSRLDAEEGIQFRFTVNDVLKDFLSLCLD